MNQGLKLVAAAAALMLAGHALAAKSTPLSPGALNAPNTAQSFAEAVTTDIAFDVSGIQSWDLEGDSDNTVVEFNIGAGSTLVGIGWDVNITANSPSWLSELVVSFGSTSSLPGLFLTVGAGDDLPGVDVDYSSGGVLDLASAGISPITVGADGILRMEFFEGFDDFADGVDGTWNSGALTLQVAAIPEPGTYALMAMGLFAVGAVARRRRQA
jgi:hypothetical protein